MRSQPIKNLFRGLALLILILTGSNAWAYNIDVLVMFDSNSTSFSSSQRSIYAKKFRDYLNQAMQNSSLSNQLNFRIAQKDGNQAIVRYPALRNRSFEDTLDYYKDRAKPYSRTVTLPIHRYMKYYNADLVIVVGNPTGDSIQRCGLAHLPIRSSYSGSVNTNSELLAIPHFGVFFITSSVSCLSNAKVVAHEFGHTAGLHHGHAVARETRDSTHFPSYSLLNTSGGYANYGNWPGFHTLMGTSTDKPARRWHPWFSNPRRSDCGWGSQCGDSKSDAQRHLSMYAYSLSRRSNWWR